MNTAQRLFHFVGALLLIGFGATLIYFYVSGRIVHYIAPLFRWGALVGGLAMITSGLFNLLTFRVTVGCDHDHGDEHDGARDRGSCEHNHGHDDEDEHHHDDLSVSAIAATLVIVLVPVCTAMIHTTDTFSIDVAKNKGVYNTSATNPQTGSLKTLSFTLEDLKKQVDQNAEGDFILPFLSIYYSAGNPELMQVLSGQPVEVDGEVIEEKIGNADGRCLRLFRWFAQCCAADAIPLGISIEFTDKAPAYPEQTWVRVYGDMAYDKHEGMDVPLIKVRRIEKIDPPLERMLY